jgi:ABC-type sugar transport system permease subunit
VLWKNIGRAALYLGPSLGIFAVFVFYPLAKSVRLSLHETNIIGVEKMYVGFSQYVEIFTTGNFGQSLWLTLLFTLYTVVPGIVLGMALAYIANWRLKGIGFFRTIFASPLVIAVASASMIWMLIFNPSAGILTFFLSKLGLSQINWLSDPKWALISICAVSVWRSLGFNTIVLLSGLQGIPEQLYESARIDGAGRFRQFKDITLPMMSPTLFFVFIVSMINALQTFGEINILTQGGPAGATNVIVYSIYREAFFNFHFSFASAQAIVLFFIILVLTVLEFVILEKKVFYR